MGHQQDYVESVVRHSIGLRAVANLRLETKVEEGLSEFALELSKGSKDEARKIAKRDAQVALRLHREETGSVVKTKLRTPRRIHSSPLTQNKAGSDRHLIKQNSRQRRRVGRNNSPPGSTYRRAS